MSPDGFLFSGTVADNIAFARAWIADQVAVVEDGRVVEAGLPSGLLDRDGRFADLYARWLAGAA